VLARFSAILELLGLSPIICDSARIMLRKTLIVVSLILAPLLGLLAVALRDNPGRAVVGKRQIATGRVGEVHYFVNGDSAGEPIVLFPSFGRGAADFNELVAALSAAGHRTLAVQPRGIDGSELPDMEIGLGDYGDDIAAVLDAERIEAPVVVLGHAFGNRVARAFAQNHPDRVARLILLAAGGRVPMPEKQQGNLLKALLPVFPEEMRREAIAEAFFAAGNRVPQEWMRGWYSVAGFGEGGATASTPYAAWGAGGGVPILVIDAIEDRIAHGAGAALAAEFPARVEVVALSGAGHAMLPERPEELARIVIESFAGR
jgi:pimeloyl-ACP methyl ester carboxylesterase